MSSAVVVVSVAFLGMHMPAITIVRCFGVNVARISSSTFRDIGASHQQRDA